MKDLKWIPHDGSDKNMAWGSEKEMAWRDWNVMKNVRSVVHMKPAGGFINKHASIINRLSHIYFDQELERHGIGCGQQFFLLRIAEVPGISLLSLAQKGFFDKGTTARAVKKLEESGYVRREIDEKDRRIVRLYITEKAEYILDELYAMLNNWYAVITQGLTETECAVAEELLEHMSGNACRFILQLRSTEEKRNCGGQSYMEEKEGEIHGEKK